MSGIVIPLAVISSIWFFIGFIVPIFIPRGPNKGITVTCFMLTAVCCWVLWISTYIAQLNPLFGPQISNKTLLLMKEWGF